MKKLWLIIVALLVSGGILCFIGIAMGASGRGFYFNEGGIKMYSGESSTIYEDNLEEIKNVDITTYYDRVNFISSDHYGLEVHSRRDAKFTFYVENGKLVLSENKSHDFLNFNFTWESDYVNIYFPADAEFDVIVVKNATGEVYISDLKVKTLDVKQATGEVTVKNCEIANLNVTNVTGEITVENVSVEMFDADMQSGDLRVSNLQSNGMRLSLTSGEARVSGNFLGNNDIRLITGDVHLNVEGLENAYNRDISVLTGEVTINDVRGGRGQVDFSAPNSLKIKTTSGDIRIDFKK